MSYGIDFGTTNSVAAFCDVRTGYTVPCLDDGRPHPSVVWLTESGNVVVGAEAKRRINEFGDLDGNQFVSSIKRQLGNGRPFHVFGQHREPFEIAAKIFEHIKKHALERFK